MKELSILILLALSAAFVNVGYHGISNAVKFHYMCGIDIPWYASYFLDVNQCPNYGQTNAPAEPMK
jgi:hypothetical protein